MNYKKEKLDIIVLAGQSNAEGNGVSSDETVETVNDVFELIDCNNYWFDFTNKDNAVLKITLPVQCKVQVLQDHVNENGPISDLSISFVKEYKKSKFYDPERRIMVVKAAVGGTGFAKEQWGVNNYLYKRLIDMVDLALSFNKDNRIVALLWHQGEHDAYENAQLNDKERYNFYYSNFVDQTQNFFDRYNKFDFPIIVGEFVNEWANLKENINQTKAVEQALKDASTYFKGGYVKSDGLLSNNQRFNNGDNIHFCKDSLIELGKRYFKEFERIKNEK